MQYTLRAELSDGRSFTYVLPRGVTTVGRTSAADLVLDDLGVSRLHARLHVSDEGVVVEDLGSTNGTRLGGVAIEGPQPLEDGDELLLGQALLTLHAGRPQRVEITAPRPLAPGETLLRDVQRFAELNRSGAHTVEMTDGELRRREEQDRALRVLYHGSRMLSLDVPEGELYRRIVQLALRAVEPDRVALLLCGPRGRLETVALHNPDGRPLAVNGAIAARTVDEALAVLTVDREGEPAQSVLSVPLLVPGERDAGPVTGLLYAEADAAQRPFEASDLDLLALLASHAATVLDNARLVAELTAAKQRLAAENVELKDQIREKYSFAGLIGDGGPLKDVMRTLHRVRDADATVLITGESGTGKELAARTLHYASRRRDEPFVAVNCAAIPENLLEAELFGIERGVATGVDARPGKFEQAGGGTLFLDEVGEMPLSVQVKLLRVLEQREFERLGGRRSIPLRARIVAATNRDLSAEVAAGRFRKDLFFRLNVVPLRMPTLRERPGDIALLADHFLREFAGAQGKPVSGFTAEAMARLQSYDWPGNVRELKNEVERIVALWEPPAEGQRGLIAAEDLAPRIGPTGASPTALVEDLPLGKLRDVVSDVVERVERSLIRKALDETGGNKLRAAALLGISREGLRKKMIRYEMV